MSRPILAVSSWVCKYPDDLLEIVKQTEFRAIEWDLDYIPVPLSSHRRHQLREGLQRLEISLRYHLPHSTCDVGSKNSKVREVSEKYLQLNLELIAGLGAGYAVLHFAQYEKKEIPPLTSLVSTIETASKYGITIAIENLPFGPTSCPKSLKRIVSESGVEVALDVGHATKVNALPDFLNLLSSKITHIHFYGSEDNFYNHKPFLSDTDALKTADLLRRETQAEWWTFEMGTLSDCVHLLGILRKENRRRKC